MSRKTSTAALDTFRQRFLSNPRRVPRHPGGEKLAEIRQAQLAVSQEGDMRSAGQKRQTRSFRTILPVVLRVAFSLFLWALGARMDIAAAQTNQHFASGHCGWPTLSCFFAKGWGCFPPPSDRCHADPGCRLPQPEAEGSAFH